MGSWGWTTDTGTVPTLHTHRASLPSTLNTDLNKLHEIFNTTRQALCFFFSNGGWGALWAGLRWTRISDEVQKCIKSLTYDICNLWCVYQDIPHPKSRTICNWSQWKAGLLLSPWDKLQLLGLLSTVLLGRYTVSTFSFQKRAPIMFLISTNPLSG